MLKLKPEELQQQHRTKRGKKKRRREKPLQMELNFERVTKEDNTVYFLLKSTKDSEAF